MREVLDNLPSGALAKVEGDCGSLVRYVDKNLEIRTYRIGKSLCFMPFFWVPPVAPEMLEYLKDCLRKLDPEADELVLLRREDSFFLCTIGL